MEEKESNEEAYSISVLDIVSSTPLIVYSDNPNYRWTENCANSGHKCKDTIQPTPGKQQQNEKIYYAQICGIIDDDDWDVVVCEAILKLLNCDDCISKVPFNCNLYYNS